MDKFVILETTTVTLTGESVKWSLAVGHYDFIEVSADELHTLRELIDDALSNNQTL